jgi:GTP-binding protein
VDTLIPAAGGWWRLVDTAGIRRKGKTKLVAEKLSVVMARKQLARADVAVLVLDAREGVTKLDATIGGYAHESGCSAILALNKWDAVEKELHTMASTTDVVRRRLKFLDYAPIVFLSALTGEHLDRLRQLIAAVSRARAERIPGDKLKRFLEDLQVERATVPGGRSLIITRLEQVSTAPPRFLIHSNLPRLHFAVERFLENRLRERFGFLGTPIRFRLFSGGRKQRVRRRRRG